jgi:hypothetical protein
MSAKSNAILAFLLREGVVHKDRNYESIRERQDCMEHDKLLNIRFCLASFLTIPRKPATDFPFFKISRGRSLIHPSLFYSYVPRKTLAHPNFPNQNLFYPITMVCEVMMPLSSFYIQINVKVLFPTNQSSLFLTILIMKA